MKILIIEDEYNLADIIKDRLVKEKYTVKDGEYKENFEFSDIAHPSNKDFREYIETELFKIYDNEIEGGNKENE